MSFFRFQLLLLLPLIAVSGCKKPEIQVYLAPKDPPPPPPSAKHEEPDGPDRAEPAPPERPKPKLAYEMPNDWIIGPTGQVSAANFLIHGENGAEATVNITPLANFAGKEEVVINMWRQQAGQPPLPAGDAAKALTPVEVAGEQGQLFEVAGSRDGKKSRIVTVMVHRPEGTWFYKLAGDEALVGAQRPAFLEFLKTVRIETPQVEGSAAESPTAPPKAAPDAQAKPPAASAPATPPPVSATPAPPTPAPAAPVAATPAPSAPAP